MDPEKTGETGGRDPETGRFLPGNSANPNGRPRGVDLRKLAQEKAREDGVELGDALWSVTRAMLKRAVNGDVQAAKLLFDKLCDNDAIKIEHSGDMMPRLTPQEVAKEILRIEQALADDGKS